MITSLINFLKVRKWALVMLLSGLQELVDWLNTETKKSRVLPSDDEGV